MLLIEVLNRLLWALRIEIALFISCYSQVDLSGYEVLFP